MSDGNLINTKIPIISLKEGNTSLLPLVNLTKKIGKPVKIYAKYEGLNPTGSFKDRGMTLVISKSIAHPDTIACAISIGSPQSFTAAKQCQEESQGWFVKVTDQQILSA